MYKEILGGMSFRVIICGSRTWDDWKPIRRYVDSLPDDAVVIEGGARGPDSIARACAKQRGLEVLEFPAHWHHSSLCQPDCDQYVGPGAGHARNTQMLMEGQPNMVVAFVYNLATSTGTRNMVDKARSQGIPVMVLP